MLNDAFIASFFMTTDVQPTKPASANDHSETTHRTGVFSLFWGLFALAALVYLGTTGVLPLVGRDEPRYVQIGREMLNSGDWITPRLGGYTWFEKPILLYWMVAGSFAVFGVSEWAARLGPALCGLGSGWLLWWSLRGTNERWAQWSCLALLSSGGIIAFSHGATFDIVLTFCVTLALAAWWKAQTDTRNARTLLALFWAGVGLAFMAKGLVAFVLTLGTVGLYAALRRERVQLGFWWGLPLALAVSGIWYIPVTTANGQAFINEFFVQHQFQRFTSDKFRHHQPPWFYLEILPLFMLPWLPLWLGQLFKQLKMGPASCREDTPAAKVGTFALAWTLVPLAFFSLSGSKLPSYVLPSVPGCAILVGLALDRWMVDTKRMRWGAALTASMLLASALITTTGPGVKAAEKQSVRKIFGDAHEQGLGHTKVIFYGTTPRAAQFYAASTLVYGRDGEPLRIETIQEIRQLVRSEPLLVLMENKDLTNLQKSNLKVRVVSGNGKLTLAFVSS